jgi:integrase
MPNYHLFNNIVTGKNGKLVKRWYYWYYDETGKQKKKSCRGCKNRAEAESYISQLPPLLTSSKQNKSFILVRDIAESMYIPGSSHVSRRKQTGKSTKPNLLSDARRYVDEIVKIFGDKNLVDLESTDILNYLFQVERSGSWKNRYLEIFREVYREAAWQKYKVSMPIFDRFVRNSKKSDILTTEDIDELFHKENFSDELYFYMFWLALSAGLRLGEVRAVRPIQLLPEYQSIVVDGFISRGVRMPYNKTGSEESPRFRVALLPDITLKEILHFIDSRKITHDDLLFSFSGKPIDQRACQRAFEKALIKSNISKNERKITPHSLRYTYVTRTRRLLDATTVQMMAGHSSIEMNEAYNRPELLENAKMLAPNSGQINRFFE